MFDRIMQIHQITHEHRERDRLRPNDGVVMTIEPFLMDLGAGFIARDAVRRGKRGAAEREARAVLAARQRQAIDRK